MNRALTLLLSRSRVLSCSLTLHTTYILMAGAAHADNRKSGALELRYVDS
jgi:hypothetical protein